MQEAAGGGSRQLSLVVLVTERERRLKCKLHPRRVNCAMFLKIEGVV